MKQATSKEIESIRSMIRKSGLRATPTRIAVLTYATRQEAPFSHGELVEAFEGASYESSTLFRALNDFAEHGLMRRLELGDHLYRYEVAKTGELHVLHPHFLCTDCGAVSCVRESTAAFASKAAEAMQKFSITDVLFKGLCGECVEK